MENKVIVEIKAVDALTDIHMAQILTYLKWAKCSLGPLISFNVIMLKDEFKRVVNNLQKAIKNHKGCFVASCAV